MTERQQRGQILVMVAAGMVVLLGIGALVVDLGISWMLRRQEQNAADPASLAAARFIGDQDPSTGAQSFDPDKAWDAACYYAIRNGIFEETNADCDTALDPNGAQLEVVYPPDERAGDDGGHQGKVQVVVTKRHSSFFGAIFGQSEAIVSAQAVASRERGETNTHSLIALRPDGCSSARIRGDSEVHIYPAPGYTGPGGYVHVEDICGTPTSDDACGPGGGSGALDISGSLHAPKVNVRGSCKGDTDEPHGVLDEAASTNGDPLSGLKFPDIAGSAGAYCGDPAFADQTLSSGNASKGCGAGGGPDWYDETACPDDPALDCVVLQPGVYYGGWDLDSNMRVNLTPGIYIIAGGGISIPPSASLDSLAGATGPAPILIFNTDNPSQMCPSSQNHYCQQDLDLKAENLQLAALRASVPCPPVTTTGGCPFGGMVIWYDPQGDQGDDYSGITTINGDAELYISGTIYAPRGHVDLAGNATINTQSDCATSTHIAAVQIISWTWDIGGTGDLCMPYDPTQLYKQSTQGLIR